MDVNKNFPTSIAKDLFGLMTGKFLGEGIGRSVFEFYPDPSLVIKIEHMSGFQNVREYEIWDEIKDQKKYAKYFAPCVAISPCGTVLLQKRTRQPLQSDYPDKVPVFFFDMKYDNYGILESEGKKQFVCHDYGTWSLCNGYSLKTKNADWWE